MGGSLGRPALTWFVPRLQTRVWAVLDSVAVGGFGAGKRLLLSLSSGAASLAGWGLPSLGQAASGPPLGPRECGKRASEPAASPGHSGRSLAFLVAARAGGGAPPLAVPPRAWGKLFPCQQTRLSSSSESRAWLEAEIAVFARRQPGQAWMAVCGDITQKGYEKKRAKLLARYIPLIHGVDPSLQAENRVPGSSQMPAASSKQPKARSANSRDERFRSDVHTEAVQAALAKYKERKMPMPSKRRSVLAHSSVDTYTPPDTSSASEDEGSLRQQGRLPSAPFPSHCGVEPWLHRAIQGSSTSSSNSSTSSHPGGKPAAASNTAPVASAAATALADLMARAQLESHPAPPDVTTGLVEQPRHERPQVASVRGVPRGYSSSILETADGVPVNSRVSSKIQQLLNTLKRPKRPPLKEFFVDDFEELLEVHQPDPNQPKPEGSQMMVLQGEPLGVGSNWPPSLLAALQRWGTTQPKAPCLTALDTTGKAVYTLTYGKLWSRSVKLAYTLLHKLPSKSEPLLKPGDRVALVFPNSDPVMFMVAFYGCLLAELIPVPIEVPLTRKDAGSQQIGFLLGSCGVTLALTTDACQKGLPKAPTGEVATFKGWPRLVWFVIDGKHLGKPSRDWQPPVRDASAETAYIEYKTSKEDSTVGITVSHASVLAQCRALTQACSYAEAETLTNVLDFKRDAGLWHGVLTSVMNRMHVVSIPYALMKVNPLSWIQKVCSYKARVALVKSRDMHWSLLAQRDQRDVSLSSLRMLIVADGANPWSVSSCDAFLNVFQSRGLRPEVICPCASSSEALTVAIRRPPDAGGPPPGKAVLSMSSLSYGVIRVDTEEKLSVLTVQDVGQVMPGANVCVVKVEGTPYLCRTDEVGEVCVHSGATGTAYYGLVGITKNVFETIPVTAGGAPISEQPFTRTGLLGFIGPAKSVNLSCVRTCMVVAEERPRIALTQSFSKLFKDLGLSARAVSTTFGCRVNVAICLQGTAGPDPTTVYVDMRALRHDRVRLVERGSPHSLPLMESGKILPGVKVIIAHTETKGPLGDSHLGEIWVSSPHNATGYYTVYGEESLHADHFSARLSFGDTQTIWARTGYLGFLRRTDLTDASGERHDALYVVGSLDETLELRGMRYHPIDIETSVIRAHKSIAECAVFTWTNLLVVVVELEGPEQEALDLVALVTNVILEEHFLIVGVVVIVDPGVIPINSRGEKQRMHLRDGFLADQLDPIYVAYNM
ncbi:disco-interacting protein 2 homolog A [Gracilinanus agilis]|uniref:disco-interacting protein 2 homolog A n=1 Tax=Gracilinanus agilis TaxID=191870 RepID=UPI001CFC72C1|nr:disco-interacting protein 2 homolog A [Gracilinanus agilis]